MNRFIHIPFPLSSKITNWQYVNYTICGAKLGSIGLQRILRQFVADQSVFVGKPPDFVKNLPRHYKGVHCHLLWITISIY